MITLLILYCLQYSTAFLGLLVIFFLGAEALEFLVKKSIKIINSIYLFLENALNNH